jgi:cytochrome c-type biogenesis protein CcmE
MASVPRVSEDVLESPWKTVPSGRRTRRRMIGSLAGVAAVILALVAVLAMGARSALEYYLTVPQALAQRASLAGQTFRMEGVVVPGSIRETPEGVDFSIRYDAAVARVEEIGNPPQLFQPSIPVVVQGHFEGTTFVSDLIMVKHTSSYVAAHPSRIANPGGTYRP